MTAVSFDGYNATLANPLDILEMMAGQNEWPYERTNDEEITVAVSGEWCDFHIRYFWVPEEGLLQAAGMLDMRVPDNKKANVLETINMVNEQLAIGHFAIWTEDSTLMFRHSNMVETEVTPATCEKITDTILSESNKYYPVFQFVLWAGKTPADAMAAAMLETVGEA
ncbi:YbjN domain-containing protein [Paremcibacter congregatus]|mgnify:CR=1 FL=1|uniref:YbjN domain-containing protein n=1 Tax=Paremcibacter congregatus TaxID=2043170 RepID=UPI0030ED547F|tara:strand:+ start:170 stop:670 length:501 start_codon:yes stop_codon:yes gene_type:complete